MGNLKLLVLESCHDLGQLINRRLQEINKTDENFIVDISQTRFNNGEGKIKILETIRGKDVYILADVNNYSCTYEMYGLLNHMGPDEHFADIKRAILSIMGHANTISVIEPLLYASRQHKRKGRESLDCANALQELYNLGVKDVVTFDAHDPSVQNAGPNKAFDNAYPTATVLMDFIDKEKIDFRNMLVIGPDMGAAERARFYAEIFRCNIGMCYKQRDLEKIVDGKNPIIAHHYLGESVKGKNVLIVDDMIASGGSILEVAEMMKQKGAKTIYLVATFALFTCGTKQFEEAHQKGLFDKVYSTNLSYVPDEIKSKPWYEEVDCSNQLASIVDGLSRQDSISYHLNGKDKVVEKLEKIKQLNTKTGK